MGVFKDKLEVLSKWGIDLTDSVNIHNEIFGNVPPLSSNHEANQWPQYERLVPEDSYIDVNKFCKRCSELSEKSNVLQLLHNSQRPSERWFEETYNYCTIKEL